MHWRQRATLPITIGAALVALVLLGAVGLGWPGLPWSGERGPAVPDADDRPTAIAITPPGEGLLAAQNLEYAPDLDSFDVNAFLRSLGSDLGDYVAVQGERRNRVADLVAAAAERHAVNPRVLLVLMELATGAVSSPTPEIVMRAAGYPTDAVPGVEAQIERLAATLSAHYVSAFMGDEPLAVRGPNGDSVTVAGTDPAAEAIGRTLAETLPSAALAAAVSGPRPAFSDLYRQWFGDPQAPPAFALGVTLPADAAWPFEGAKRHTGGPHLGSFCSPQDILAASGLDFGGESHEVLAMADGCYLGRGETTAAGYQAGKYVLLEHAGGVQVMYWHLAAFSPELQALAPGAAIPKGFPVGWSGRSGNQSAVHLHVELRRGAVATNPYSGVRITWDGQVVDGWAVRMFRWPGRSDRGVSYRGSAVRGAARALTIHNCACDQAQAEAYVSGRHPATTAPRNGMDADTVLANYPDIGLLPSSNARTTVLWVTAQKDWRQRLPWYYLIDARGGEVRDVVLDGAPLLAATECARAVWLSGGDHRLTWRFRDDGSGATAVAIQPWPFEAPSCAARPLGAPPEYDTPPAVPYDDAALASGSEAQANAAAQVGATAMATWRLRNAGTVAWGEGYRLAFADGWAEGAPEAVPLPTAGPGEEAVVALPLAIPAVPGRALSRWRLHNADGVAFGPSLVASVEALPAAEGPAPAPTTVPGPQAPQPLEPVAPEGAIAYLAGREVTLRWTEVNGAEGYTLHLSVHATPAEDTNPVYRERLPASIHQRQLVFAADVPRLYWQVTAFTLQGEALGAVGAFGLDSEAPTCALRVGAHGGAGARIGWQGEDALSGIVGYEVAYRGGGHEAWRLLAQVGAETREALLGATGGGEYAVRCRARDAAGNVGPWSADAAVMLPGGTLAQIDVAEPMVTAMAGGDLLVQAVARHAGEASGDARLSLVVESSSAEAQPVYRWDVADLAPGRSVTLTARIAAPARPVSVGEPLDGTYRFSVRSLDGSEVLQSSPAGVCLAAPDAYEAWDTTGGGDPAGAPLRPGGRQTRGLHAPGDVDHARVSAAEEGRRYVAWTDGLGPAADTVIELHDETGALVARSDDVDGPGSWLAWTAASDQTYRLVVRGWAPGSEGCGTGYTLHLQTEPSAPEVPEGEAGVGQVWLPAVARR